MAWPGTDHSTQVIWHFGHFPASKVESQTKHWRNLTADGEVAGGAGWGCGGGALDGAARPAGGAFAGLAAAAGRPGGAGAFAGSGASDVSRGFRRKSDIALRQCAADLTVSWPRR